MRLLLCSLAATLAVTPLAAQTPAGIPPGAALSLEDALSIARRNSPAYLQAIEGRRRASANVRSAYGALLPQITSQFVSGWREGRQQFFGGIALGATGDILTSQYDVSANLTLSQASFVAPRAERARAEATEADITAGAQTLRVNVTQQYLLALQQQARAILQDTLIATTQTQLELARVRVAVGSATPLEVQRAEVALGQQQVLSIQARNQSAVERLRLFQVMGVAAPEDVRLSTEFAVEQPDLSIEQLLGMARSANPSLMALRARDRAADLGVTQARGEYVPTLTLSTGYGGFTSQFVDGEFPVAQALTGAQGSCRQTNQIRGIVGMPPAADCSAITLPADQVAAIRSQNNVFPFDFTTNPLQFNAIVRLPIFNGFQREQRIQEAAVQRSEAQYRTRAQELQLEADVQAAHLTLTAQFQAVQLQEQNARTARQALDLAQERYRVGASTFVEVSQASDDFARAETDRINSIYEFHRAFAALESAVGRPLR